MNMRLRVVTEDAKTPLPHAAAQEVFRKEFAAARSTYVDLLTWLGGPWVQLLLLSGRSLSRADVVSIRAQTNKLAAKVREMSAHMDAALDAVERAHEFARQNPEKP